MFVLLFNRCYIERFSL